MILEWDLCYYHKGLSIHNISLSPNGNWKLTQSTHCTQINSMHFSWTCAHFWKSQWSVGYNMSHAEDITCHWNSTYIWTIWSCQQPGGGCLVTTVSILDYEHIFSLVSFLFSFSFILPVSTLHSLSSQDFTMHSKRTQWEWKFRVLIPIKHCGICDKIGYIVCTVILPIQWSH